jgi:hypothetical protein
MTPRCGFADAPRAGEIYEIFQHKEARATLARIWRGKHGQEKRGREIWNLLVTAFEAGLLVKNNRAFSIASMWLLFPATSAVKTYDDNFQDLQASGTNLTYLRTTLLPLMIAARDRLFASPERPVEVLKEFYENRKRAFFDRGIAKPSPPVTIETQSETQAGASVPPLIRDAPDNVTDNVTDDTDDVAAASVDLLVGEIEARIEKLLPLCNHADWMDAEYKNHLVARLEGIARGSARLAKLLPSSNNQPTGRDEPT